MHRLLDRRSLEMLQQCVKTKKLSLNAIQAFAEISMCLRIIIYDNNGVASASMFSFSKGDADIFSTGWSSYPDSLFRPQPFIHSVTWDYRFSQLSPFKEKIVYFISCTVLTIFVLFNVNYLCPVLWICTLLLPACNCIMIFFDSYCNFASNLSCTAFNSTTQPDYFWSQSSSFSRFVSLKLLLA